MAAAMGQPSFATPLPGPPNRQPAGVGRGGGRGGGAEGILNGGLVVGEGLGGGSKGDGWVMWPPPPTHPPSPSGAGLSKQAPRPVPTEFQMC